LQEIRRRPQAPCKVPGEGSRTEAFTDLKETFPAADHVSGLVIFDIGGNKYRLTATVNYDLPAVLIEEVLTHEQYDQREL